jgi:antibiotic biosynthesis monooxygenase (ABM) superfamily enzyme
MTTAPTPVTPSAPAGPSAAPAAAAAPSAPPSVHVRAVITWLAIFPLVAVGMMLIAPISESWHPVLRAFVLTLVVVPLAVYVVVPWLLRRHAALRRRRAPRSGVGA